MIPKEAEILYKKIKKSGVTMQELTEAIYIAVSNGLTITEIKKRLKK